jgi:hypothetical protein
VRSSLIGTFEENAMHFLINVVRTAYGLLVDDGWIATGTLATYAITGLWVLLTHSHETLRNLGGLILTALLLVLLFSNLYATGAKVAHRIAQEQSWKPIAVDTGRQQEAGQ